MVLDETDKNILPVVAVPFVWDEAFEEYVPDIEKIRSEFGEDEVAFVDAYSVIQLYAAGKQHFLNGHLPEVSEETP